MPFNKKTGRFDRSWNFVDQREQGDEITRSDLDAMANDLADGITDAAGQTLSYVGEWNPETGIFPTSRPSGARILARDAFVCLADGAVGGATFNAGDSLVAIVPDPGQIYFGRWLRLPSVSLPEIQAYAERAEAAAAALEGVAWRDTQTIVTVAGQQTYDLAYDPGEDQLVVALGGQALRFGRDYALSGATITLIAPVVQGGAFLDYSGGRDLPSLAGLRPFAGPLAQTKLEEPFLGFDNGVTNTEVFTGAARVSQGLAQWRDGGTLYRFILQSTGGTTNTPTETKRIAWYAVPEGGGSVTLDGWTDNLHIGHQKLACFDAGSGMKMLSQYQHQVGHEGTDTGKGFSVIDWDWGDTTDANVTNYQLFGYAGSGHRFQNYHTCTPSCSADGKWLVLLANDVQDNDIPDTDQPQDTLHTLFVYDMQEVLAAADPLLVDPVYVVPLVDRVRGERLQYTQDVVTDGSFIYVLRGYSQPRGRHIIIQYTMRGEQVQVINVDHERGSYTLAQLMGADDLLGIGTSFEPEGIIKNGAAFWTGINFAFDALMREGVSDDTTSPGNAGYARAISMAHEQGLSWFSRDPSGAPGSGTQEEVFRLVSMIHDPAIRMALNINDAGFDFRERVSAGASLFRIAFRADADAHLVANAAAIGGAPSLSVAGTNANTALSLVPKGTGWLHVPIANVREFADDAAAAAAGLSIGAIYRTGSALKIRAA